MQKENNNQIIRFSVSLPEKLLEELDKRVGSKGYASRSEFTRDLIRSQILDDSWQDDDSQATGALCFIYQRAQIGLCDNLHELIDTSSALHLCSSESALGDGYFLESIHLQGKVKEIKELENIIASLKGVFYCQLVRCVVPTCKMELVNEPELLEA